MKYMLLIYSDESHYGRLNEAETEKLMAEYGAFGKDLEDAGQALEAERLQPTPTATTVRLRDGETLTSDGPFAETKEQLGGFYMIEADNLDEALAWAKKIPTAKYGSIEVRPIWEME